MFPPKPIHQFPKDSENPYEILVKFIEFHEEIFKKLLNSLVETNPNLTSEQLAIIEENVARNFSDLTIYSLVMHGSVTLDVDEEGEILAVKLDGAGMAGEENGTGLAGEENGAGVDGDKLGRIFGLN